MPVIHDPCHLGHVEIVADPTDLMQIVLHTNIDDEGSGRHQVAGADQFAEPDLVGNVREDLPQSLTVAPVGRGGDAVYPAERVAMQGPVDDTPVAIGDDVMGLINHQQVERRHGIKVVRSRQCRDHGEGDLAVP
jgi:hypothetical protein